MAMVPLGAYDMAIKMHWLFPKILRRVLFDRGGIFRIFAENWQGGVLFWELLWGVGLIFWVLFCDADFVRFWG